MVKLFNKNNQTELVRKFIEGGEEFIDNYIKYEGISRKLFLERFRHQFKDRYSETDINTEEEFLTLFNYVNRDWFVFGRLFRGSSSGLALHVLKLLFPYERFKNLYLEDNLTMYEIADLYKDIPIVNRDGLKRLSKLYGLKKPENLNVDIRRRLYHDDKEKSKKAQKRREATMKKRYGVNVPTKNPDVVRRAKATNTDKYGVDNPMKVGEFKNKMLKTASSNYSIRYKNFKPTKYVTSKEKLRVLLNSNDGVVSDELRELIKLAAKDLGKEKLTLSELSKVLGVPKKYLGAKSTRSNSVIVSKNNDILVSNRTGAENTVYSYISSIYKGTIVRGKHHRFIGNKQIDIYIPDYRLGVEYNGSYYHAIKGSKFGVAKGYHKGKTDMANDSGVNILHIFEYDWTDTRKRSILKSRLAYKLHSECIERVYARSTIFRQVGRSTANYFLKNNSINSKKIGKQEVAYGLFYDNVLVFLLSVDIHDTSRATIKNLVPKKYTSVVGGVSKLIKNFSSIHQVELCVDSSKSLFTSGENSLFEKLGFTKYFSREPSSTWSIKMSSGGLGRTVKIEGHITEKDLKKYTEGNTKRPFLLAEPDFRSIDTKESIDDYMIRHRFLLVEDSGSDVYKKRVVRTYMN